MAILIPLLMVVLPAVFVVLLVKFWEWQAKRSNRKNPLTSDLLRGPGEALREKLADLRLDVFSDLLLVYLIPTMVLAYSLSLEAFSHRSYFWVHLLNAILAAGAILHLVIKLNRNKKILLRYKLGLDAETAVGQELNHLMRDGYWVYHDFFAEDFNIDHVVVGPNGVFAVETKGRAKPINRNGSVEREVIYDGDALHFPTHVEDKSLKQAEYQAKWLEKWLTSAVGEHVSVTPVLAIPGWYINKTKPRGIPVINGKNPSAFFTKFGKNHLSTKLQQQIVHQLESKCRSVLPQAYR